MLLHISWYLCDPALAYANTFACYKPTAQQSAQVCAFNTASTKLSTELHTHYITKAGMWFLESGVPDHFFCTFCRITFFSEGPTVLSPQIWFGRLWLIFKILINYTFLTHSSAKLPIQGPYKSWDAGWYFLMLLVIMAHTRTVGDNRFYLYLMYFLHFFVFECMLVYFRRCGAHWDSWR